MHLFASLLASVGGFFAGLGSQACATWVWDEEKCPNSLIK